MSAGTVRQIHAILWLWLKSRDDNARRPPAHASQAPLVTAGDGWHGGCVPLPPSAGAGCPSPHYPAGTAAVTIQRYGSGALYGGVVTLGGVCQFSRAILRSRSKFARPYMSRLRYLILQFLPSSAPLLKGRASPAVTACWSRRM